MDKVCDICGSIGAAELISTCFKCNISREHIYCMELLHKRVPEVWFCTDCLDEMFARESDAVDTLPTEGTINSVRRKASQMPETFKRKRTLLAHKKKNIVKKKPMDSLMPAKEVGTPRMEIQEGLKCEPLPSEDAISLHNSGGKFVADVNSIHYDVERADLVNMLPKLKKCLVNNVATGATWRGSFEISDSVSSSEFYDGFQSYLPVRVHRKAYEFSKKLPGWLLSTLLPRCNIWESIFKNDHPCENDIGLYFFPSNFERSKQQYDRLLQRMDKEDLVLRSCVKVVKEQSSVNGVELLIFTSKWLYVSSVLKSEPFLWGIFRPVRGNQTVSLPSCDCNIGTKVEEQLLKVKEERFTYIDEASEEMGLGTQLQVHGNFL
ncbi:uncharacterized protein LOC132285330 isoform X2 [Cornus florida]|uniref:uncharacterized protein LOC132285330 isoform X2 n=1 Tax=Cornus florida TaxID=4283 RepID=UPI0028A252D6|nr:uncharacterized protein LOC132285330 isoform X2 [Cornus florida]